MKDDPFGNLTRKSRREKREGLSYLKQRTIREGGPRFWKGHENWGLFKGSKTEAVGNGRSLWWKPSLFSFSLIGLINSTANFHAATLWVHFGTFGFYPFPGQEMRLGSVAAGIVFWIYVVVGILTMFSPLFKIFQTWFPIDFAIQFHYYDWGDFWNLLRLVCQKPSYFLYFRFSNLVFGRSGNLRILEANLL